MNFQPANPANERALRELVRSSSMPGWIRLAFAREPDFFQAAGVQGKFNQVLVALEGGRVVGMGCRSIRPAWVDGRKIDVGYLSGLRLMSDVRRSGALARGYAALKALHDEKPVPAYLTTVMEDNTEAAKQLTSGRAGLPHYLDRGRFFTYAINLNRRRQPRLSCGLEVRRGGELPPERVMAFMNECGSRRQFFPAVDATDFGTDYLRGLQPADLRVAIRGEDEIVGLAAVWDQSAFKQNIVEGYAAPVRLLRPAINVMLRLAGFRPMPACGEQLNMLYVAFCCARNDDPATLRFLLERIYADHQMGIHHFLVAGFHERDPLRAAMSHFLAFRYTSRLYLVYWDDGLDFVRRLDPGRVPHLEVATL